MSGQIQGKILTFWSKSVFEIRKPSILDLALHENVNEER